MGQKKLTLFVIPSRKKSVYFSPLWRHALSPFRPTGRLLKTWQIQGTQQPSHWERNGHSIDSSAASATLTIIFSPIPARPGLTSRIFGSAKLSWNYTWRKLLTNKRKLPTSFVRLRNTWLIQASLKVEATFADTNGGEQKVVLGYTFWSKRKVNLK